MSGGVPKRVSISRTQRNTPSKAGNVVAKNALVLCSGRRSRRAMCNYIKQRAKTCAICPSGNIIPPVPSHPHPTPNPPVPPPPLPTVPSNYTLSISHYGVPKNFQYYTSETKFKDYCNSYLNFIYTKGKEVEIDRVLFCIPGNPGPAYNPINMWNNGNFGTVPPTAPYTFIPTTTSETDGVNIAFSALTDITGATATVKDPWVYTYFVKPILKYNKNNLWAYPGSKNTVIQVGFTFYHGKDSANGDGYYSPSPDNSGNTDNWTTFVESAGDLVLPTAGLSWNAIANPHGNDWTKTRNNIAQEFAYMRHINNIAANDPDIGTLAGDPTKALELRVSHCTWDQEGNAPFPDDNQMDTLWNTYLGGGESLLDPRWSSTSVNTLTNLINPVKGPDRYYREIYDLFDYSKDAGDENNLCSGTGGGSAGPPRQPSNDSYLNIMSGAGSNAEGTTNLGPHTRAGWDVIGLSPDTGSFTGEACGTSGSSGAGGVISKKWPTAAASPGEPIGSAALCQNKIQCGGGTTKYATSSNSSLEYNLQAAAGSGGSKYFYAKWVLHDPDVTPHPEPFGKLPTSTDPNGPYITALNYALRLMTGTGWMNFFGSNGRLNNSQWSTYTASSSVPAPTNGVVLMFSTQSRFQSAGGGTVASNTHDDPYGIPDCGGEECFGSWKWSEFKAFLDAVVAQMNTLFPGFGEATHPVHLGLYEWNYVPIQWLEGDEFT